jgi:hypothetical protein
MVDHKDVSKNRKGPDGVITEPKNFLTSPPKKGTVGRGTLLGEKPEHMVEPFDRKKELDKIERIEHEKKL